MRLSFPSLHTNRIHPLGLCKQLQTRYCCLRRRLRTKGFVSFGRRDDLSAVGVDLPYRSMTKLLSCCHRVIPFPRTPMTGPEGSFSVL